MPKVAYSEEERKQIRQSLIAAGLDLMSRQGIQHTTVEQIYKKVGISRTFFYSFFPAKEDLIVETLYLQQPKIIQYAQSLTIEEQKLIFRRLSDENYEIFRRKQSLLFGKILECFGIKADKNRIALFTNLSLTAMIVCRAIPDTLPLFVPEVARETVDFQIEAIIDRLEQLKEDNPIL